MQPLQWVPDHGRTGCRSCNLWRNTDSADGGDLYRTRSDGTPLHQLLQVTELGVNSYHHQAVKTLAPSLTVMAESEDGLVEAVYMPEKTYVWAVQWHPELSYQTDKYSRKIFESFVAACK